MGYDKCDIVEVVQPLGYLDMLRLMGSAERILTDSGGIQKEAYMLGMPCITLRENTEWVETLGVGLNLLVGADKEEDYRGSAQLLPTATQKNIFGGAGASGKILKALLVPAIRR